MLWEQLGFVLHRRPYRETSLLVSLLTPGYGRVDAVAKGVRAQTKQARQKAAWLQPFQPLTLSWRERTGLVTINRFEPSGSPLQLDGTALACGFYLNELLLRLVPPGVSIMPLFEQYDTTLRQLALHEAPSSQSWLLRQFELALLDSLGAGLHLPEAFKPAQSYRWQAEAGLQPAAQGIEGRCLAALLSGEFEPACLGQQKRLLREILAEWLGPQPLRSVRLLKPLFNRT